MIELMILLGGLLGIAAASGSSSNDEKPKNNDDKKSDGNDISLMNFPDLTNKSIYSHQSSWENPITGDYMKHWINIEEDD